MQEIKLYRELTAIETFDGILYTTSSPDELDKSINDKKFLQIGDERIAIHQIKRYGPRKLYSIESHILSKPKDIQEILRKRIKDKTEKIGKGFESIQEIENFISSKGL